MLKSLPIWKKLISDAHIHFTSTYYSLDDSEETIRDQMHRIKEEMRTTSKSGKAALLFLVYCGHGILSADNEIFAVMPNGSSFVNLSNFA